MAGKPMINDVVFLNGPGKGRSDVDNIPYFFMGKIAEYRRGAMHGTFEPLPGNIIKIRSFLEKFFDDLPVAASKGLPRELTPGLEPFPTRDLLPYEPSFLSGFLADDTPGFSLTAAPPRVPILARVQEELRKAEAALDT